MGSEFCESSHGCLCALHLLVLQRHGDWSMNTDSRTSKSQLVQPQFEFPVEFYEVGKAEQVGLHFIKFVESIAT